MGEYRERVCVEYKNLSDKFSKDTANYNKQYCSIYLTRLKEMEVLLLERIKLKWGDKYPVKKLYKLSEEINGKTVIMGTLFKDQSLKPSVLKQLAESNQLNPQPILSHFTDDSDVLFIEDELQRYHVLGSMKGNNLVTGITCALLGTDAGKGKFLVEDYTFADFREQIERPMSTETHFIVFLSGLDFINQQNFAVNLELFNFYISGLINDDSNDVSKIARVIIAGNSVRTKKDTQKQQTISMTSRVSENAHTIEAVKVLDTFLMQLCQVIDVDLMPGENDPSNHILPQKQMHFCMFPKSIEYKTLNLVPNPYNCSVNNVNILGTSGQPITDILRYSDITDPLIALENCLKWNHLAPTCPDTLGCFPFYENDPFIIEKCPHVFFAGNQEKFSSKMVKGPEGQKVRLISIPEFCGSFQAVALNLKTLECDSVVFKA
ncbi:unnamed protein product [Brassicogethes aeneus]|uniref:DNA polymerase delta small subunit n=1 Tax=Brassicogethes aeneus TaxID=1431903 RepID=A0A9P0FR64_BRAAE|nr:unnamed protein product [Brassicogethes aeneus]